MLGVMPASRREIALYVWEKELGQPYVWGGDDPVEGWDCSGLVIEGLKAAGVLAREGDWTAAMLAQRFPRVTGVGIHNLKPGCLVFWERGERIGHVEIVWVVLNDDSGIVEVYTIGASGGGSRTRSREGAIRDNAFVKVRPATGWVLAVDPFQL